jgi:hypothetical protein
MTPPPTMQTYDNDTTKFHDIAKWTGLYAAARDENKQAIAVKWLDEIIEDAITKEISSEILLYSILEPHRKIVRGLVAALPKHEIYERIRLAAYKDTPGKEGPIDKWLLNYLGNSVINANSPLTRNMSLVRNLWLSPSLEDRQSFLFLLSDGPMAASGLETPPNGDVLLRNAAWDVARELEMEPTAVQAATKITIESYRTGRTNKADPKNSDPLSMAILRVLSLATIGGGIYSVLMPLTTAKSLVVEYPTAAITLFHKIQFSLMFSSQAVHETQNDNDWLTSLATWVPTHSAYIAMAHDVLNLRYSDVLRHLIEAGAEVPPEAVELPDISSVGPEGL